MQQRKAVDYEEDRKKNEPRFFMNKCRLLASYRTRAARKKPRDPLEEKLFARMDLKRQRDMIRSGELVRLGERAWELKL